MNIASIDHIVLTIKDIDATGLIISFYFEDPDGNLIEVANHGGSRE